MSEAPDLSCSWTGSTPNFRPSLTGRTGRRCWPAMIDICARRCAYLCLKFLMPLEPSYFTLRMVAEYHEADLL